jgi:hypothetical protein
MKAKRVYALVNPFDSEDMRIRIQNWQPEPEYFEGSSFLVEWREYILIEVDND